jgi:uncharacterized protein YkwD
LITALCCFALISPVAQARSALSRSELSLLQAINAARTSRGLAPLRVDRNLERAARAWSATLLRTNSFTHGAFASRMQAFHVRGRATGENLAWGSGAYSSARALVQMWLASPEHRANMLRAGFRRIGIGTAYGTFQGNAGAVVATTDFAGH